MKVLITKDESIRGNASRLISQPVIIRLNKFHEESVKEVSKSFNAAHNTGQSVIPIIIDSYGGYVHSLLAIMSEISNSTLPVATIVVGKAMSCGAILMSMGTPGYRYIDKDAAVMMHDVSGFNHGKIEDLKSNVAETSRLNNLIFQRMAQNCGHKNRKYFLNELASKKADWYMTPVQAKKHNMVDYIGIPNYKIHASVDVNFGL